MRLHGQLAMQMTSSFEAMSPQEIFAISRERQNISFTALRSTLGFEEVEQTLAGVDLAQPFMIQPLAFLTSDVIAHAFSYSKDDPRQLWVRFFSIVSILDGQVFFTKLDEQTFRVEVRFEDQSQ